MIAIAGGKGGCGKTTTTLGVARALLDAGIGARAVDMDAGMPNLHLMANVDRDPSLAALADDERDGAMQRDAHGAQIAPAPRALGDLDVPAALDAIRPGEGVALLDCPAGAGPAATTPLREADAAILVTTSRSESVEDAGKTGRMARSLGVPVLGAIVTGTERVSRGIESELAIDRALAIPDQPDPLEDSRVRECYGAVASWIESWLRERTRERSSRRRTTAERPRNRSVDAVDAHPQAECPNCGGVRSTRRGSERPRRRRDRRSPRFRGSVGTRSSSRGGGAPSGRR